MKTSQGNAAMADVRGRPTPDRVAEPICLVADPQYGTRRLIAQTLEDFGIQVFKFDNTAVMLEASLRSGPDLIFLDFGLGAVDGASAINALVAARVRCPVQLMSELNPVVIEKVRRSGERKGLRMLPVLYKPFRHAMIAKIAGDLGLRRDFLSTQQLDLQQVLAQGWLEPWYQPKIDLRTKRLVGVEMFVRARHPEHGILPPECFLSRASEAELLSLTTRVLVDAVGDWQAFSAVCRNVKVSINVPACAVLKLPIVSIVEDALPEHAAWPELILEITEDELLPNLVSVIAAATELRTHNIGIAIDDFGGGFASLARLPELPFCELKIDRGYIASCNSDPVTAGLCETIVELAHGFGVGVVAEGIESMAESATLAQMGCDVGQGFLFARPMPKSEFLVTLRERVG